jgi:putative transcriptional regulator
MDHRARISACAFFLLLVLSPAALQAEQAASDTAGLRQGMLLVADPRVRDPRFSGSVILLLSAGPGGAAGVIINRPTATKVSSHFAVVQGQARGSEPIYFGGPVGSHELLMLRRMRETPPGGYAVPNSVIATKDRMMMLDALMTPAADGMVRFYEGYAGWAAGQLEREVVLGGWHLLPAETAWIFSRDAAAMWSEASHKVREQMPTNMPARIKE